MKKKIILTILVFITYFYMDGQNTFNLRPSFNEISAELLTSVLISDDFFYTMGITSDTISPFYSSALFSKYDWNGVRLSYEILSSQEKTIETWNNSLYRTPSNDFVNVGYSFSPNNPMSGFFIKFNEEGNTIINKNYTNPISGEEFYSPRAFQPIKDNSFIFATWIAGQPSTINGVTLQNADILVTKIDSIGNILWEKDIGTNKWEFPMSMLVGENNQFIVGGVRTNLNFVNENYQWQTYIIGLDSLGNTEWTYLSPISEDRDGAKDMVLLDEGSLIVASGIGYEQDRPSVNEMWFEKSIFKLNPQHELEWEMEIKDDYLSGRTETTNLIALSDDSGFVLAGTQTNDPFIDDFLHTKGWLMKFDENGDSIWTRRYLYPLEDKSYHRFYDMKETPDGGLVLCGESRNNADNIEIPQQSWLLKLDQHGCLVPGCHLGVSTDEVEAAPFQISIYPNPTTDYLNVYQAFSSTEMAQKGVYQVLDVRGKVVAEFLAGQNDATLVIPVWDWAKGSYFLQLVVDGETIEAQQFIIH